MMQNIYSHYKQALKQALRSLGHSAQDVDRITLQPPREKTHGDMATNAALVLGNRLKQNPREIAQTLAPALQDLEGIEKVEIAGVGFINLFLKDEVWQKQVKAILEKGDSYGKSSIGEGKKINVEYVSANPTGPLHIGHARGAIFGDCLAALMENVGYEVAREYYINDEGVQIDILAKSLLLRMEGKEVPAGANLYPGAYLIDIAKTMDREILTLAPEAQHQAIRKESVKAIMVLIKKELAQLNIKHDIFSYESELHQDHNIEKAVAALEDKGLVYQGSLPPPKGKEEEDWEAEEQTLFKSSQFGDDRDRSIKKSNGDWTYFAGDIAYHYDKIKRGFDFLVNVFGSDHGGYVKRLSAIVEALSNDKVALDVCLMHLVRVVRNGKPEMMSKRAGNFIGLQELLDEIGADALRFIMLTRKHDAPLDIDIEVLKQQSNDNPVFYVQYAHARCCSVLAQGGNEPAPTPELLQNLSHESELNLIKVLCRYPNEITEAALEKTPHRLAFYLQDLAAAFHAVWNQGNEDENLRFVVKNATIKAARLSLVCATRQVLSNGLTLMGIKPIEELR